MMKSNSCMEEYVKLQNFIHINELDEDTNTEIQKFVLLLR